MYPALYHWEIYSGESRRSSEWMRLGTPDCNVSVIGSRQKENSRGNLQNIVIQTDVVWLGENQVQILESLGQPETLHLVLLSRHGLTYIEDLGVAVLGARGLVDALEHAPCNVLQGLVSSNAVHDEDGLEGLRSEEWMSVTFSPKSMNESIKIRTSAYRMYPGKIGRAHV